MTELSIAHECGHAVVALSLGIRVEQIIVREDDARTLFGNPEVPFDTILLITVAGIVAEGILSTRSENHHDGQLALGAAADAIELMGVFGLPLDESSWDAAVLNDDPSLLDNAISDRLEDGRMTDFMVLLGGLASRDLDVTSLAESFPHLQPEVITDVHAACEKVKNILYKHVASFAALFKAVKESGELNGEQVMEIWDATKSTTVAATGGV